jgi:hypothetical protein
LTLVPPHLLPKHPAGFCSGVTRGVCVLAEDAAFRWLRDAPLQSLSGRGDLRFAEAPRLSSRVGGCPTSSARVLSSTASKLAFASIPPLSRS